MFHGVISENRTLFILQKSDTSHASTVDLHIWIVAAAAVGFLRLTRRFFEVAFLIFIRLLILLNSLYTEPL